MPSGLTAAKLAEIYSCSIECAEILRVVDGFGVDSYNRLASFKRYYVEHVARRPREQRRPALEALGQLWSCCDNISFHQQWLRTHVFGRANRADLDAMMDPDELAAWRALPDTLTIYRGCYPLNERGLSWTLDEALAHRFPFLARYLGRGDPRVLTMRVNKAQTVLKNDRQESEIIVPRLGAIINRVPAVRPADLEPAC